MIVFKIYSLPKTRLQTINHVKGWHLRTFRLSCVGKPITNYWLIA
jgi:hypothetical protein